MKVQIAALPERIRSCAFTGHRLIENDFSLEKLKNAIDDCIEKGCVDFYCGMAKGFDLLAGKEIVDRKKEGKTVRLIACVPYAEQSKYFLPEEKILYDEILKNADETNVLFTSYTKWCMAERNKYMVERADVLITYLNADTGGTYKTVKQFQKRKKGYIYFCN